MALKGQNKLQMATACTRLALFVLVGGCLQGLLVSWTFFKKKLGALAAYINKKNELHATCKHSIPRVVPDLMLANATYLTFFENSQELFSSGVVWRACSSHWGHNRWHTMVLKWQLLSSYLAQSTPSNEDNFFISNQKRR